MPLATRRFPEGHGRLRSPGEPDPLDELEEDAESEKAPDDLDEALEEAET